MDIYVTPISVEEILPLRELHRTEMNCQIVHDSLHERGFTHSYSIEVDGETAEYGTVVGFADAITTSPEVPGAAFGKVSEGDHGRMFRHREEGVGEWMIESGGEIVATGGILFHYNPPYGDIYMEVAEPHRRLGYGSYLVQELERTCYDMDKVPAARCGASNTASRAALQRAGMLPCASILTGVIRDSGMKPIGGFTSSHE